MNDTETESKPMLTYDSLYFNINKLTLPKFMFLNNRRKISKNQVGNLTKSLLKGNHFDSPIVVNKIMGNLRLIDGNHRIFAIKQLINRNPKFNIEVNLIVYNNLSQDKEIETFKRWNIGKKQTTNDFIQSISSSTPVIKSLLLDFPVPLTIYKTKDNQLSVRAVINSYFTGIKHLKSGNSLRGDTVLEEINSLTEDNLQEIRNFYSKFSETFGKPSYKSPYYTGVFLNSVSYIVFLNKGDLWLRLYKKVLGNQEVIDLTRFSGRMAMESIINKINDLLLIKPTIEIYKEE